MKLIVLLLLCLISKTLLAQQVTGYVFDEDTRQPIQGATVKLGQHMVSTKENGYFSLLNSNALDTIFFSHISYKNYLFKGNTETELHIFMKKNTRSLSSVVIIANHNYKADSIRNRNEFSTVFNYKKTSLKDVFIKRLPGDYNKYVATPNSFNSIVRINLLQVAALASRNKVPVAKLQNKILSDEEETYINRRFSKEKISQITSLKGDSLQIFINRTRPSIEMIKTMTDYELIKYIKKKYSEF